MGKKHLDCFGYGGPYKYTLNYGIYGLPLVVKDKYDQQPYTIRIPNLNGIIAIEFDDETK